MSAVDAAAAQPSLHRQAWPPAASPPLQGDEFDLWWIEPDLLADLPRRERSQQLLAGVLASYLPADCALHFAREEHGRPYLLNPGAPDFNLSDTRGGSVIAVAARGRVGVDLERSDRQPPAHSLAERWFHPDEAAHLATLDPAAAAALFIRLWTAKEASCKATGSGIFGWLDRWQFAVDAEQPRLLALPEQAGPATDWHHLRLSPARGFTCVLACQGFRPQWRRRWRLDAG